jgi:hypothetical protein
MALPGEDEIYESGEKIKAAAAEMGIDLNDPNHKYTLWSDLDSHFQYSGSYGPDSHAAWSDGRNHPPGQKIYVAKEPLHGFGIMAVEP